MTQLILASASPRRQELLGLLGYPFTVQPMDIEEIPRPEETPADYVQRLAREKAQACANANKGDQPVAVLGSDTVVVCEGEILEKPLDFEHYVQMMQKLSGTYHEVLTAVNLTVNGASETALVTTRVWFRTLSDEDILRYWQTGEPKDKAGGYGIQGPAGAFVRHLEGSFFAVMGLPLFETEQLLRNHGIYP
ncbi:Maf family protein [Aliidiomarina sanyensis]|uniref:dTTP/UTP pyrophosphatase n=1 Tax=Aliidiomarina sanyensis TaxID=1249555 RepID=A0A432WI44_9GAMM|nr:Maf family protein [Aliidiomarina sanyensis]RUO33438.1 hypothetical protein CWE11_06230 [Aliidiomarina sanyensis]